MRGIFANGLPPDKWPCTTRIANAAKQARPLRGPRVKFDPDRTLGCRVDAIACLFSPGAFLGLRTRTNEHQCMSGRRELTVLGMLVHPVGLRPSGSSGVAAEARCVDKIQLLMPLLLQLRARRGYGHPADSWQEK